ncbi:hypothetical protein OG874_12500 [Nocardia sp. NBC_00565]|uniref:hypothetical protein n=1 Tax=Nocardia sp. NBC_00565 TaxID=2975993 RepID=UPI002E8148D8|nr:hypothetical protein [Nocardia sp. NBC_00565]WUC05901.1 hypothetical protein OG874_12500 [Nocardia sp. NBC_00565]
MRGHYPTVARPTDISEDVVAHGPATTRTPLRDSGIGCDRQAGLGPILDARTVGANIRVADELHTLAVTLGKILGPTDLTITPVGQPL